MEAIKKESKTRKIYFFWKWFIYPKLKEKKHFNYPISINFNFKFWIPNDIIIDLLLYNRRLILINTKLSKYNKLVGKTNLGLDFVSLILLRKKKLAQWYIMSLSL